MLVIYSFSFVCYASLFIACFFITLLFLFQDRIFLCILSFLLLCLFYYFVFMSFCLLSYFFFILFCLLSFCLSSYFVFMSFCLSCYSVSFITLSLCHSVSFHLFVALPLPLFLPSFRLYFYSFTCLFFDIFAWIFKYIKILLSFYFFVCLSTLFLFSFIIYVIDFLI